MSRKKTPIEGSENIKLPPALTEEALENAMISQATALAYKQLCDGTASSQVIVHYLKLGSSKERLEREIQEKQKELLQAKTEAIHEAKNIEKLYSEAVAAMQLYKGQVAEDD